MTGSNLLSRSLVWDNHAAMPFRPHDQSFLPQLSRHKEAGFDVVMLNIGFGTQTIEEHIRLIANFRQWISVHGDQYVLIDTVADIERARSTGRLAVGFNIEGANAIDDQPSLVQLYYDLGVRWMLLAYNRNSRAAGGCQDEDCGFTAFGKQVVDEMERVGMVLCLSHTGERSVREMLDYARNPVIFSHSNPRGAAAHPRNISDEMMLACARTGGVVGINGIGIFLGDNDISSANFVRHIDYAVSLIGPQHVSLALDYAFDRAEVDAYVKKMAHTFPAGFGYDQGIGMLPPEQLPEIVDLLLARGYADADVQAILGGNLLRIARQVWKPTRQTV
ncbi:membrane dipeptidase [Sphingobium sp. HBC34]|uniref:Membrane dipeptidase n=1 Tax=Sphingobium cyanobacteriorum TaxID=3063954 RepID=A0ABT8ZM14_9SPHN|nr:membrane dipeptidase [Sphingobium sp. HBC34]MDO7835587.1 membrane dipeptidase [Sphingobium sp. HBC34]